MLDLGIELRSSGWVINAFPHWAPLRPCEYISYVLYDYISAHIIVLTNESKCIHTFASFHRFCFHSVWFRMIETLNHWALGLLFEGAFISFKIQGIQRNWHVHSQEAENTVSYPITILLPRKKKAAHTVWLLMELRATWRTRVVTPGDESPSAAVKFSFN